jgi:hypothetical protein
MIRSAKILLHTWLRPLGYIIVSQTVFKTKANDKVVEKVMPTKKIEYLTSEEMDFTDEQFVPIYQERVPDVDLLSDGIVFTCDVISRRGRFLPTITYLTRPTAFVVLSIVVDGLVVLPTTEHGTSFHWDDVQELDTLIDLIQSASHDRQSSWLVYPQFGSDREILNTPLILNFIDYWTHRGIEEERILRELHRSYFNINQLEHEYYQERLLSAANELSHLSAR